MRIPRISRTRRAGYVTVPRWLARLIPSELTLIKLLCGSALLVALVVGARVLTQRVPPAQILLAAGMVIVAAIITALTVRAWLRRGIDG